MDSHLKDIQGSHGQALAGRRVALAITGSIAAIETPRLARLLMRQGADVFVVMSRSAARLVSPTALEWCTGNPVVLRLTGRVEHIGLVGHCDLVVLAPATANSISKMALGLDDTPVTTLLSTALGARLPLVVAPGMHEPMLNHPAVQDNLGRLRSMGVRVVMPQVAENKAKMADIEAIVEASIEALTAPVLQGQRVMITAGPTIEYLDPIRTLGNRSSGRMGVALAREARRRGAEVTLIYGPGTAAPSPGVHVHRVETTAAMLAAVEAAVVTSDIAIFAAAVADFSVRHPATAKIPTSAGPVTLELVPTPKIIDRARELAPELFMVGFKAEDESTVIASARAKMAHARLQMMVANSAGNFGTEEGVVYILDKQGETRIGPASKSILASRIWEAIGLLR